MKRLIYVCSVLSCLSAVAGWNLDLASGWRVVGGANYNAGLKTDLRTSGARALPRLPAAPRPDGASREEAENASQGILNGDRVDYPNGGFIDPDYSGRGELPDHTWNWRAPAGAYAGGRMNFDYDYVDVLSVHSGGLVDGSKDTRDMAGFTIEVQRNLGQWGDFGLDLGFGFNYYHKDDCYRSSGEVYRRTDTTTRGAYTTGVEVDGDWADWARNPDGSYGGGTYGGPGALLPIGSISFGDRVDGVSSATHALRLDSSADWEEIELMFTLKPYYDVTEWFRVVGTLGVAVSRGELDFEMTALSGGGRVYSSSEKFHEWTCCGVGGLGGMFHYAHACLGFDFLARFLDDDVDVRGRNVSGSVEHSPWAFRVYAGFEF
ncbi:MAG: hypothetical protein ACI4RA_05430 [Kiritimatiellia bacterium]